MTTRSGAASTGWPIRRQAASIFRAPPARSAVRTRPAPIFGKSTEEALFSNRYRVVGVAVASQEMRSQIFAATNQNVIPGNKPRLAYVRLGLFEDESAARQLAIDLKNNAEHLLGAHFIMRDEGEAGVLMDFGPLRNVTHAERYCEIMLSMSTGLVDDCYTVLEFPGLEPLRTFSSTAMLKPSANAIRKVMMDDSLFDLQAAARQTITLREGDGIGATDATLVKVTPRGIIVVAENGDIETLPIDYLPEKAFDTEDLVGSAPAQPQIVINTPPPVAVERTSISRVAARAVFEVMVSKKSALEPAVRVKSLVRASSLIRSHSSTISPVSLP